MIEKKLTPSDQVKTILLACSQAGARMFRMQVGLAWIGSRITKNADGSITIHDPRPLKSGTVGMCDTGGWTSVIVTPEMVGQRIAVSTWIEVKQGSGRPSKEQTAFIQAAKLAGCRAGVARSVPDALAILTAPPSE